VPGFGLVPELESVRNWIVPERYHTRRVLAGVQGPGQLEIEGLPAVKEGSRRRLLPSLWWLLSPSYCTTGDSFVFFFFFGVDSDVSR